MTSGRRLAAPALAIALAGLAAGAAPAGAGYGKVVGPSGNPIARLKEPGDRVRLSDEKTITRWTTARRRAGVLRRPRKGAERIAQLRFLSASRALSVYGLLRGTVDADGRRWLEVRVPGRPNGRVGWVPASALNPSRVTRRRLVVDRRTLRATLYQRGERIWRAPVGVGKAGTPTPGGHYFIDRMEGAIFGSAYGPRVFFTTAFSSLPDWPGGGVVGIHGTNQPQLVPGRPSHGCIRVHNADIVRLGRLLRVGTPLRIR